MARNKADQQKAESKESMLRQELRRATASKAALERQAQHDMRVEHTL